MSKKIQKTKKVPTRKKPNKQKPTYVKFVESDSQYLLKLVVVILLATLWLKFSTPVEWLGYVFTALPIGLLLGLILIHTFEHQVIDRKIWYAVLIVVGIVGYFVPAGIVI